MYYDPSSADSSKGLLIFRVHVSEARGRDHCKRLPRSDLRAPHGGGDRGWDVELNLCPPPRTKLYYKQYVYIYIDRYVYTYICMYIYMYIYIYADMYVYIHIHTNVMYIVYVICVCVYTYTTHMYNIIYIYDIYIISHIICSISKIYYSSLAILYCRGLQWTCFLLGL